MKSAFEVTSEGVDLVVVGPGGAAERKALLDGRADGLVLNYARGFTGRDLSFIEGLPVQRLRIIARTIADCSPISSLGGTLRVLGIQCDPRASIDLRPLPMLTKLSAPWCQVDASISFAVGLEDLILLSYGEEDLHPLGELSRLTTLSFKDRCAVRTLDGIQYFEHLSQLGMFGAPRLSSIDALLIARSSDKLRTLRYEACKGISSLEPLKGLTNIRFFEFSESGAVDSLSPLAELVRLEKLFLYGSTNVSDGSLLPIAMLPRLKVLKMRNRASYSPSVPELQQLIALRLREPWEDVTAHAEG